MSRERSCRTWPKHCDVPVKRVPLPCTCARPETLECQSLWRAFVPKDSCPEVEAFKTPSLGALVCWQSSWSRDVDGEGVCRCVRGHPQTQIWRNPDSTFEQSRVEIQLELRSSRETCALRHGPQKAADGGCCCLQQLEEQRACFGCVWLLTSHGDHPLQRCMLRLWRPRPGLRSEHGQQHLDLGAVCRSLRWPLCVRWVGWKQCLNRKPAWTELKDLDTSRIAIDSASSHG